MGNARIVNVIPTSVSNKERNTVFLLHNLRLYYDAATSLEIENGLAWYANALAIATNKARFYNVPVATVAGVLSALSPSCSWVQSLVDTDNVLQAVSRNIALDGFRVSTYGSNKAKAYNIAVAKPHKADDFFNFKSGRKTTSFYHNILGNPDYVTIDRHAISAALGGNTTNISPQRYDWIADAYKILAQDSGITPYQLQAIVWTCYRNVTGIAAKIDGKEVS